VNRKEVDRSDIEELNTFSVDAFVIFSDEN
jgi:hypothetical protein